MDQIMKALRLQRGQSPLCLHPVDYDFDTTEAEVVFFLPGWNGGYATGQNAAGYRSRVRSAARDAIDQIKREKPSVLHVVLPDGAIGGERVLLKRALSAGECLAVAIAEMGCYVDYTYVHAAQGAEDLLLWWVAKRLAARKDICVRYARDDRVKGGERHA